MDVSLTFCLCPHGAMIFPGPLWPNQWAYFKPQGAIWKIWISSFHRYLLLYCGLSGLVTAHCQSRVLFDIFPKSWIFHIVLKTNFWKLFFKLLSFEDDLMKICETNWKQSQISQIFICRKKLSKILSRWWVIKVWSVGPMWAARKWSDMSISSSLSLKGGGLAFLPL